MTADSNAEPFHIHLAGRDGGPLDCSFEQAESALQQIQTLYFEPDGSFAFKGPASGLELFGMVYDAYGAIQYVEIRGRCDWADWQRLVACFISGGTAPKSAVVKSLPGGELQTLQDFERLTWSV
ncbi:MULTISPECIES: hypothetical protein [Crateriforma]|uniref:hypothetical protein n=1 Tax=Crateriforma TaxID=2714592 RepID=UPI0011B5B31B|nr:MULTISPECIES: hypothetical protein [Crateriforma]